MDNESPQHIFNLLISENTQLKRQNKGLQSEIFQLEKHFETSLHHLDQSWQKDYLSLRKKYIILEKLCNKLYNRKE